MISEKEKKGWCVFFDWIENLKELSGEDFKSVIIAVNGYAEKKELPKNLNGAIKIIVGFMIDQMERSEENSRKKAEAGRKGGERTACKKQEEKKQCLSTAKAKSSYNNNNNSNSNNGSNSNNELLSPLKSPEGEKGIKKDEGFLAFWQAYPRKCGKADAEKAYLKLNPSGELQRTILEAVERNKASPEWSRDNGKYIPYPSTWLNGRRWEDEEISDGLGFDKIFSIV